jgi:ankyrin repeat protein
VAAAASASVSAVRAHIGHDAVAGQEQDEAMHAATQSTLLELLSNPAVHPSSVHRFLVAFPLPECMPPRQRLLLARQCWEHLLDNRDPDRMEHVYGKMELLRNIKLHCPTELFRQHCHLEQVQLLVDAMGSQVKVGNFLCQLRRCLSVEGQHTFRHESRKVQQLQIKLETADLLMVVHTLGTGNVLSINAEQLQQLKLVHLARHGPVSELESVLRIPEARQQHEGSSAAAAADPLLARKLVNASYQGFPILFQPLIECHKGWLERLEFLLRAGANAATVYEPWNSTALHMLFYQKLHKVKEAHQVRAIHLLMQHGAKTVLNLMDKGSANSDGMSASNTPTHRTTLLQAASAGRFQACRVLLTAGADADVVDSSNQSMLDYLFYQKHSNWNIHRRATADFTCMQLYGLVNEFRLHDLVSDELEQDCRSCGRCRFLLASCASVRDDDSHSSSSSESEHSLKDSSSSDSDMEDDRERHHAITSEEHVKPTFLID